MLFTQLSIQNFGVYRGPHRFNLKPNLGDENRPVVLFGGKNGSGKTTLLETIRLCLYGRLALGDRVREVDYETYIRQQIHRDPSGEKTSSLASVALLFEHTHAGVKSSYEAERSWSIKGKSLKEELSIYKDGQLLEDIASEYWDDFLRDLVPVGVSSLFFFDGEQIQALADDERGTEELAEAIERLLNLDLVQRLQSDLTIYIRQQNRSEITKLERVYKQAVDELAEIERLITERKQDLAQERAHLDRVQNKINQVRQEMLREGANFIRKHDANRTRLKQVEQSIIETENTIRNLAASLLPFSVTPDWCKRLAERLQKEEDLERESLTQDAQRDKSQEIHNTLLDRKFQKNIAPDIDERNWTKIASAIQELLEPESGVGKNVIRHPISAKDRYQLLGWIDKALDEVPARLETLTIELEMLEKERNELVNLLSQAPSEDVANPLISKFHEWSEKKGRHLQIMEELEEQIHRLELELAESEREVKRARESLEKADNIDRRVKLASGVQNVLDKYLDAVKAAKLQELEREIETYFNLLCRKQMLIREVQIDPRTYEVKLFGVNRTMLRKSELSAGESQLYAMSILWALRAVSGRSLPIIVDTPMGRLDSEHREAILEHFFPMASHQIILLSTDTEIDEAAYEMLKPHISHTFHLNFDEERGYTEVSRGYFTDPEREAI